MQTQCPHCDTRFRVTEAQLTIADGMVRCGICEHVFNIYDISVSTFEDYKSDTDTTHDEPTQQPAREQPAYEQPAHEQTDDENDLQEPSLQEDHAITISAEPLDETNTATASAENQSDRNTEVSTEQEKTSEEHHDEAYNFFEDDRDRETAYVVPREFHESHKSDSTSVLSTALWGIGVLFLITTLFIEYAWFNRNELIHIPEFQAEVEQLCQQLDCSELSFRAPAKIELITRNIYTHPNAKEALMVNVTIKNNATFSQPYPVMRIDFSDIRGNAVASRNFLPKEYLLTTYQHQSDKPQILAPDTSSDITLEVLDPGTQALTYEFSFL